MNDLTIGIRLTADGKGLVGEVRLSAEELKKLKQSASDASDGLDRHAQAQERTARGAGQLQRELARQASAFTENEVEARAIYGTLSRLGPVAAAVAGGALVLAKAFSDSTREQREMNNAMLLTGNYAATTRGQMLELARGIADVGAMTIGTSKQIVTQLVASGQIGAEALGKVAAFAENYANATGRQAREITPELVKLFDLPSKGAERLNQQYHFLSAAQIEHMKQLERMGELGQSQLALADAATARFAGQEKQLGALAGAWNDVRKAASSAWDSMLGVGRPKSIEERIREQLAHVRGLASQRPTLDTPRQLAAAEGLLADLRQQQVLEQMNVGADGRRAAGIDRQNQAQKIVEQLSSTYKVNALRDQLTLLGSVEGLDSRQRSEAEAKIRKQIAELQNPKPTRVAQGPEDPFPRMNKALLEEELRLKRELTAVDKVELDLAALKPEALAKITEPRKEELKAIASRIDGRRTEQEVMKSNAAALEAETKARGEAAAAIGAFHSSNAQALQDLRSETGLYAAQKDAMGGLILTQGEFHRRQLESNIQRETSVRLRKLELDWARASATVATNEALTIAERTKAVDDLTEAYQRQAATLGTDVRENLTAKFGIAQLERERQAAQQFHDDLERGLIDSIFRGFEGGKSAARNFFDSLKNMAKTTVLTPVIKWLVSPITGAITGTLGSLGIPGLANAGTGGAGGGGFNVSSLFDAAGGLNSILNGGGIAGMGSFASGFGSTAFASQATAAALIESGTVGMAGLGMEAGALGMSGMGGAMGALAAAAPYLAVAGAAYSLLKKNKTPAVWSGGRLIGEASQSGFTGSLYGTSTRGGGNPYENMWLNPTPNGIVPAVALSEVVKPLFKSMESMAKSLGLDTSALQNVRVPIDYGQAGQTIDELMASFGQHLGTITDQIADELMPNLRDFAQANETLTGTFTRLAQVQRQADVSSIFGKLTGALGAQENLKELWLSDLSPLSAQQRLVQAQGGYAAAQVRAEAGDFSGYADAARAFLTEARSYYASSPDYTGIFNEVQGSTDELVTQTFAEQSAQFGAMNLTLQDINVDIKTLPERIAAALRPADEAAQQMRKAQLDKLEAAAERIVEGQKLAAREAALVSESAATATYHGGLSQADYEARFGGD